MVAGAVVHQYLTAVKVGQRHVVQSGKRGAATAATASAANTERRNASVGAQAGGNLVVVGVELVYLDVVALRTDVDIANLDDAAHGEVCGACQRSANIHSACGIQQHGLPVGPIVVASAPPSAAELQHVVGIYTKLPVGCGMAQVQHRTIVSPESVGRSSVGINIDIYDTILIVAVCKVDVAGVGYFAK